VDSGNHLKTWFEFPAFQWKTQSNTSSLANEVYRTEYFWLKDSGHAFHVLKDSLHNGNDSIKFTLRFGEWDFDKYKGQIVRLNLRMLHEYSQFEQQWKTIAQIDSGWRIASFEIIDSITFKKGAQAIHKKVESIPMQEVLLPF
jgi:hypothetical protein